MMRLIFLAFFCIALSCTDRLHGQSYSFIRYDTKDGLPSTTVYDVTQDANGFIWFATENGLCRFDGKNFKVFTTRDGLPDNSILKVHGDRSGKVYFTPFTRGIYYHENDSIYKLDIPEKYKVDLSNIETFINKKDKVVIGAINGFYLLENGRLIKQLESFTNRVKEVLYTRVYDTMNVVQMSDSIFYIPDSGKIRAYFSPAKDNYNVVLDKNGQKKPLHIDDMPTFRLREFLNDTLCYGYESDRLHIFNVTTGDRIYTIKHDKISSAFLDNENNLWVTSLGSGVSRYPSFRFHNINFEGKKEIFSIVASDHGLVFGTDYSKMLTIPFKSDGSSYSEIDFSDYLNASGNTAARFSRSNRIYSLRSKGETLFIGTDAFLLKKTGSSKPVFAKIHPVKDIDLLDSQLLVSTGYCALLVDQASMTIKDSLLKQRATCGVFYQGDYYIGTLGGLVKIDAVTKKVTELFKLFTPFSVRITAIKRGIHDDLWIATSGLGLVQFKDGKIIRILKEQDGLTSDICTSLAVDSTLIWLGTSKGINRIETNSEIPSVTRFTSANGLIADFINAIAVSDSTVYVGTAGGITMFNQNILLEKSVCILHILDVSANNKKLKKDSTYTFPYNTMNIQVNFTAISFKSAGDITYYYKLQGLEEKWNSTTSNFINFSTLQPGDYTFTLKAINKFGIVSDTKTIGISILPPWWQTLPFRIIAITTSALLIVFIYWFNIRAVKRREEAKREIETRFAALEQTALQAQMNPHFIFNSLNSIQTFILNLDVEGANAYLTSFASLIRQTLDNSMQPLITIASEVKYLETYLVLEKLRFREKFRYEIRVDDTIDENNTVLPGMLLQPYIENSLRHGIQHRKDNNGLILFSISKADDNSILYVITDNGVGRKKAEELKSKRHIEYQSRGTFINEKRIAAINNQFKTNIRVTTEDILDAGGTVAGTKVSVLVPRLHKQ